MLAAQSQRLSWRDSLSWGLWRLMEWLFPTEAAQPPAAPVKHVALAPVPLTIEGVAYVDIGRRFPIRADRLDYYYTAAD